ncbi:MAG: hypothetical protein HY553_21390 [Elusimicrobia bacterium]|nr:hypothetical protein [Elusimicrobiota bacterium]
MNAESVVSKALETAAKEAVEGAGTWLAAALGGAPAAAPAVRVAAAAAQAVAAALLAESSPVERKVDRLLREPWRTGSRELGEALSLPAGSGPERQLRAERLKAALARLAVAQTAAELDGDDSLLVLIHAQRALGYAMLPGGGPSAARHLRRLELRSRALRKAAESEEAKSRSARVRARAPRPSAAQSLRELHELPPLRRDEEAGLAAAQEKLERAEALRREAAGLERFCSFARAVSYRSTR